MIVGWFLWEQEVTSHDFLIEKQNGDFHWRKKTPTMNSQYRRAARLVFDQTVNTDCNTDEKMSLLGMLPLRQHHLYNKLVMMRKATLHKTPSYISKLITENKSPYETRGNPLDYPKPRIDFCKQSFTYSGPHAWNVLPKHLKSISSLPTFKERVHKYLIDT